jgi:hypothetical protein
MSVQTKSNVPQQEPLRWNLRKAAIEFSTTSDTLRKSLNQISASPDPDGLFSSQQLVRALYGELHVEKVRTQRALARKLELENDITTASVLNRAELMKAFAAIADAMVSRITAANVPRSVKEDLLKELASIPLILKEVAHAQTRLRRGKGIDGDSPRTESASVPADES